MANLTGKFETLADDNATSICFVFHDIDMLPVSFQQLAILEHAILYLVYRALYAQNKKQKI